MKVTLQRSKFTSSFALAAMVAPTRSPKEILQKIKLTVTESSAYLEATDLEVGIRLDVTGAVEDSQPGAVLLPTARMTAILRESSDESITIETDGTGTKVSGVRSKYRLPGENPDEFPSIRAFPDNGHFEVNARAFSTAIKRTSYATDPESSRYALGGVKIEIDEQSAMDVVATDGRRLSHVKIPHVERIGELEMPSQVILPTRAANFVERMIANDPSVDAVAINASLNDFSIQAGQTSLTARLVDGRYPSWRQVVPNEDDHAMIDIAAGALATAIRQAGITTDNESRGVDFEFYGDWLTIRSSASEIGESEIRHVIAYQGEKLVSTMDLRYVLDFCKVVDAEDVVSVSVSKGAKPVVFRVDGGFLNVVMPMARDR